MYGNFRVDYLSPHWIVFVLLQGALTLGASGSRTRRQAGVATLLRHTMLAAGLGPRQPGFLRAGQEWPIRLAAYEALLLRLNVWVNRVLRTPIQTHNSRFSKASRASIGGVISVKGSSAAGISEYSYQLVE
ncbi:hypothetical protein EDB80DRAFT_684948 [Ilyonectria destructans]|nr:hypothetical protein EDB80DRAFT_684948 [Ilyonectria destructans]